MRDARDVEFPSVIAAAPAARRGLTRAGTRRARLAVAAGNRKRKPSGISQHPASRSEGALMSANDIDWENVIEEIESVGRSERNAVESHLVQALLHDLKAEA